MTQIEIIFILVFALFILFLVDFLISYPGRKWIKKELQKAKEYNAWAEKDSERWKNIQNLNERNQMKNNTPGTHEFDVDKVLERANYLQAVRRVVFLYGKENKESIVYQEAVEELKKLGLYPN